MSDGPWFSIVAPLFFVRRANGKGDGIHGPSNRNQASALFRRTSWWPGLGDVLRSWRPGLVEDGPPVAGRCAEHQAPLGELGLAGSSCGWRCVL